MMLPRVFLSLCALTCSVGMSWGQDAPTRPPIAFPGSSTPAVAGPPSEDSIISMENALRQVGCTVNPYNRDNVLQSFGGTATQARAVLDVMEARNLIVRNNQRGMASLRDCAPVPMAGDTADLLN